MSWTTSINTWLYGLVMTLFAGIVYLVRRVFTNQAELELLKQRLELYEHYRKEQTAEIKNQLIEIRSDLKAIKDFK